MKIILFALSILAFPVSGYSADNAEEKLLEFWEEFWADGKDATISDVVEAGKDWFPCYGDYYSKTQDDENLQKLKEDLFLQMASLIANSFRDKENPEIDTIRDYLRMEQKLSEGGGYKNKLLAIASSRIAGSQILTLVLADNKKAKELGDLLQKRNGQVSFDTRKLLIDFAPEDPSLEGNLEVFLESLKSAKTREAHESGLWAFYEELIKTLPKEIEPVAFQEVTKPFSEPSVYKLESYQIGVELFMRSTLPALLGYLEKGGKIDELDDSSVTVFNQVMGDDRWKFSFPYTGVQKPSPALLLKAVDEVVEENSGKTLLAELKFDDL